MVDATIFYYCTFTKKQIEYAMNEDETRTHVQWKKLFIELKEIM